MMEIPFDDPVAIRDDCRFALDPSTSCGPSRNRTSPVPLVGIGLTLIICLENVSHRIFETFLSAIKNEDMSLFRNVIVIRPGCQIKHHCKNRYILTILRRDHGCAYFAF